MLIKEMTDNLNKRRYIIDIRHIDQGNRKEPTNRPTRTWPTSF